MEKEEKSSSLIVVSNHTYPLCKLTDMSEEMKQEAIELCVTATETYPDNYEHAAKLIKQNLDKKFGGPFQVIVGESYAFYIIHQLKTLLYMFTGGNIAILIWQTV